MNTNTPTLNVLHPEWVGLDVDPTTGGQFNVFADGTRLPVCAGAEPEEEGNDDNDDSGQEDDNNNDDSGQEGGNDDDSEEEDEDVVKLTRAEFEKMRSQKSKANKEAARRRKWLENAGIDPHTGKAKKSVLEEDDEDEDTEDDDEVTPPARRRKTTKPTKKTRRRPVDDDEDDDQEDEGPDLEELEERWTRKAERAAEKAATRAEMKYKIPLAKTAAKAALADAGWTGKNFDRVMKLIDLDDVELDDDGEIIGIDDQVDGIKDEFPDWFRRRGSGSSSSSSRGGSSRKSPRSEGKGSTKDVGGSGQAGKKEQKGWKQSLAEQAFKGGKA